MIPDETTHPNDEQLSAFILARLSASELAAIEAHVADCAECARRFDELPANDPFLNRLRCVVDETATAGSTPRFIPQVAAASEPDGLGVHQAATIISRDLATDSSSGSGTVNPGADVADERVGTSLGKYRILEVLGRGGMGIVYRARDPVLQRDVALKVLPRPLLQSTEAVQRFLIEARAAASISHPNVASVYDVLHEDELCYLVMELVSGGNASQRLQSGNLPWGEATSIVIAACQGLSAAHQAKLIHRDIKPNNLMLAEDGSVKLVDFGLAKALKGASLTKLGQILGTPNYMSPEQCLGRRVDTRSDIYSLGATYYELLTAQRPYADHDSRVKVMYAHCHDPIPDPHQIADGVPRACGAVVARAMAKQPADRYQACDEMRQALAAVQGETLSD